MINNRLGNKHYMKIKIYPYLKNKARFVKVITKRDITQTAYYYKEHYNNGKKSVQNYAAQKGLGQRTTSVLKPIFGVGHTLANIRGKDVPPIVGCALFSFTNPFVGMGIVGYALGKSVYLIAKGFVKGINRSVAEYMPKIPPHTGIEI